MPNHTINVVRITGPLLLVNEFVKRLAGPSGPIDFNSLVPRPESLNLTEGADVHFFATYYRTPGAARDESEADRIRDRNPEAEAQGLQYLANVAAHGFGSWFDWSVHNWGTKWNAYDIDDWEEVPCDDEGLQIRFSTAWAPPVSFLEVLSEKVKAAGLTLEVWYSNEDGGSAYDPLAGEWITVYTPLEFQP